MGRCGRVAGVGGTNRYVESAGCWLLRSSCLADVLCLCAPLCVDSAVQGRALIAEACTVMTALLHKRQCRCTLHEIWTCTDSLRFAEPMAVYSHRPVFCVFFGACPWSVTFSDPTSERRLPKQFGVLRGGGAVGFHAAREQRCTLFRGGRGAPLLRLCFARGEAGSSSHGFGACLVLSLSFCFLSLCGCLRAWDAVVSVVRPRFV